MSKLPKIGDVENESTYGYVFAVSGPGKILLILLMVVHKFYLKIFSRYGRKDERFCYVRVGKGWLLRTGR